MAGKWAVDGTLRGSDASGPLALGLQASCCCDEGTVCVCVERAHSYAHLGVHQLHQACRGALGLCEPLGQLTHDPA